MNVLILYASYSGSTYLVSEIIQEVLAKQHSVHLKKITDAEKKDIESHDVILIGTNSWDYEGIEGSPHHDMLTFIQETCKNDTFPGKSMAVYGCGDRHYTYFCGGVDHLEKFLNRIKAKKIGESLRIDRYYFFEEESRRQTTAWAKRILSVINSQT